MPVFSRRRLQQMLVDLAPLTHQSHLKGFVSRLNDKRFEIAIPAEVELGLVWSVSQLDGFEAEPEWYSSRGKKPEGVSEHLMPGHSTVFDVKAISDRVRPGNVGMRKASRQIAHLANRIRKGSGKNLSFFFHEQRDWNDRKSYRDPWVARDFQLTDRVGDLLRDWLIGRPTEGDFIDILESDLAVRITWEPGVSPLFNYRSSGVGEIFDVANNHIVTALSEKADQLRSPNFDGLRGVLVADVGCATLKRIRGIDPLGRSCSGTQIIQTYIDNCRSRLDFVCVFSPQTERSMMGPTHHFWAVNTFVRMGLELPMDGLQSAAGKLPAPRFDGYELESLHDQDLFGPQSPGWYLGSKFATSTGTPSLKATFSVRALHEFLAGRITGERLRETLVGGAGAFEYQLKQGSTISSARIVPSGLNEDDDLIELTFSRDPAAHPLVVPESSSEKPGRI